MFINIIYKIKHNHFEKIIVIIISATQNKSCFYFIQAFTRAHRIQRQIVNIYISWWILIYYNAQCINNFIYTVVISQFLNELTNSFDIMEGVLKYSSFKLEKNIIFNNNYSQYDETVCCFVFKNKAGILSLATESIPL